MGSPSFESLRRLMLERYCWQHRFFTASSAFSRLGSGTYKRVSHR